ncbi:hypothetical protein HJG60_008738 [Phyllostomus discolor]|uniref:Uncharacterized protein n=1 Tax=Phyllostomus discolor TaxID=89673 RepID=A0A833YW71_9CHIR|nr:hypothetical protein HJG60_008738 [Phyllostomus discolor]
MFCCFVWGFFCFLFFVFFLRFYLFLERGEGRAKEGEKHQYVVASHTPPTGTWPATQACALTGNPPFGSQACVQSTAPHQPGLIVVFIEFPYWLMMLIVSSCIYWPFICPLENYLFSPLPVFKLGGLYFYYQVAIVLYIF